jgi:hypothetical protein
MIKLILSSLLVLSFGLTAMAQAEPTDTAKNIFSEYISSVGYALTPPTCTESLNLKGVLGIRCDAYVRFLYEESDWQDENTYCLFDFTKNNKAEFELYSYECPIL